MALVEKKRKRKKKCDRLTLPHKPISHDLQAALVDEIERLDCIPRVDDTRYIDLARSLTDHFNVHIALRQRREHLPRDTDHIAHLPSNQGKNGHIAVYRDLQRKRHFLARKGRTESSHRPVHL